MKAPLYIMLFVLLFVLLFASACSRTKDITYAGIQNFSMQQDGKPAMALDIRLYNPNHYKLKLKDADVAVFLNETNLGKLAVQGLHIAPANDTFLLPVSLNINPNVTLQDILRSIMMGSVQIKLAGSIKGGRHGIYINVPVNFEGSENLLSSMSR